MAAPGRGTTPPLVSQRAIDRLKYAHDASHYRMVPSAVATPRTAAEVGELVRSAGRDGVGLTFRAGGTSLSGQASTSGVLVDVRRHFRGIEVLEGGLRVRVQPGATVRAVNARLAPFGRRLGPDPASEVACTVGGVVANNSSGMVCGVTGNSYATLDSAVLVLPSGTVVDTGAEDADERLAAAEPDLHAGLAGLRDRVRGNPDSVARIRRLFALKNTLGYGVNSYLDFERPVDVLEHLVIGSEGTLAFVAEATFDTVPVHPHAATGLLVLATLAEATAAVPALVAAGFATIELLDATSLTVAQRLPGVDPALAGLRVDGQAALLVELQAATADELAGLSSAAQRVLASLRPVQPVDLTTDAARRAALWQARKGLYTAVAGARPSGTTALLEDVAVPVENLLATTEALTGLFRRHAYEGSVIFGHARDGNLHFLLNERFDAPDLVRRHLAFTEQMVELVLGQGGTLKAEHGTGRAMAPYVRRQYGDELYDVMVETKRLVDPRGVLNPGVLLNEDADAAVADLKTAPAVEQEVDRCVECGYCEPVCPSRDLTTTPRQRIVLRREIARAEQAGDHALAGELDADYAHDAIDTCAVDGLCGTVCPVGIDTGDLVRRLRAERVGAAEAAAWTASARHWDATTRAASFALTAARALPDAVAQGASGAARSVLGRARVPGWTPDLPAGGRRRSGDRTPVPTPAAVFFPACLGTMFAPERPGPGAGAAFEALCSRAGVALRRPDGIAGLCCGTPWKSKGLPAGTDAMRARVLPAVRDATDGGRLPVVVDSSSCASGLAQLLAGEGYEVLDAVTFVERAVLPGLPAGRPLGTLVLHPTCSSVTSGTLPGVLAVAARCAERVVVPEDAGCCAFAGDRGMLLPELTASATAPEAAAVARVEADAWASTNRTCEMGLSRATGRPYRHLLEVLEEVTRPA